MPLTLSVFLNGALQVKTPFLYLLFKYQTNSKRQFLGETIYIVNMMGAIPLNRNSVTVKGSHG